MHAADTRSLMSTSAGGVHMTVSSATTDAGLVSPAVASAAADALIACAVSSSSLQRHTDRHRHRHTRHVARKAVSSHSDLAQTHSGAAQQRHDRHCRCSSGTNAAWHGGVRRPIEAAPEPTAARTEVGRCEYSEYPCIAQQRSASDEGRALLRWSPCSTAEYTMTPSGTDSGGGTGRCALPRRRSPGRGRSRASLQS